MNTGTTSHDNVNVHQEQGLVVVSLSKTVEVIGDKATIYCLSAEDYELDHLDSIFTPLPRDEYLRELVADIITGDTSESGLTRLFEIIKDLHGEHGVKVKRDDYDDWSRSNKNDFDKSILDNLGDDYVDPRCEVAVMKKLEHLVFIIVMDGESKETTPLELEGEDVEDVEDDEIIDDMDDDLEELLTVDDYEITFTGNF